MRERRYRFRTKIAGAPAIVVNTTKCERCGGRVEELVWNDRLQLNICAECDEREEPWPRAEDEEDQQFFTADQVDDC